MVFYCVFDIPAFLWFTVVSFRNYIFILPFLVFFSGRACWVVVVLLSYPVRCHFTRFTDSLREANVIIPFFCFCLPDDHDSL